MEEIEVLKSYVQNSDLINDGLRSGVDVPEKIVLDGLLTYGEVPNVLYRLLSNDDVRISKEKTIKDAAYLSYSVNFNDFIDCVGVINHLACYRIEGASPIDRINVRDLLPEFNDEGEYILPRDLELNIINVEKYIGVEGFEKLLEQVDCDSTSSLELSKAMGIETITLYRLEVKH